MSMYNEHKEKGRIFFVFYVTHSSELLSSVKLLSSLSLYFMLHVLLNHSMCITWSKTNKCTVMFICTVTEWDLHLYCILNLRLKSFVSHFLVWYWMSVICLNKMTVVESLILLYICQHHWVVIDSNWCLFSFSCTVAIMVISWNYCRK